MITQEDLVFDRKKCIKTLSEIEEDERKLLVETIEKYKKKRGGQDSESQVEIYNLCLAALQEKWMSSIPPIIKEANEKFNSGVDAISKEYGYGSDIYKDELQEWKENNADIVNGRDNYCSMIRAFDETFPDFVKEFIQENYKKNSQMSEESTRPRSFSASALTKPKVRDSSHSF